MTKLLFVITKDDVGGAQKYIRDLEDHLDKNLFEIKVLTGGRGKKGGIRFLSNAFQPYFLFLNDAAALLELFFIFKKEKPDVVHLNSSKAGVIGAFAAKLAGVPQVVFTAHGWVFNPENKLSRLRRRFYIWFHRLAAGCQDRIINVSEYDRQLALKERIAPEEKLLTVYNGISDINFLLKKDARKNLRALSGREIDLEKIWIGSVGRLVSEKDYETLIESAVFVPEAVLVIIGSGYEYRKLKAKAEKFKVQDRVFILGNIAPAAPYLKAFDLFVLSSVKEGLPYTVLEAMSAELPIVVTRVGGMTEIVDGRGLVMPPREPQEMARAINYLLKNSEEAKKMAAEAKRFLREKLTLERMIKETERVYENSNF